VGRRITAEEEKGHAKLGLPATRRRECQTTEPTLFSIGEVAAMLSVSPHTIRAWERRYQVLTPRRSASRQRRYSPEDIAILLQVKRSVTRYGVSLKVAVKAVQGELTVPALDGPIERESSSSEVALGQAGGELVWRSVVDLIPQAIFVLDRTGRVVEANAAAAQVLAFPLERMVGRRLVDFVEPGARKRVRDLLQAAFGQPQGFEACLRQPRQDHRCWFVCRPFLHDRQVWVAVFAGHVQLTPVEPTLAHVGASDVR